VLGFLRERRAFEQSICQSCGTRPEDWDRVKDHPAFMVESAACRGCRELERHRLGHRDDTPGARAGMKDFLVPYDEYVETHPDGEPDDE
jgi:hypothetical protein